MTVLTITIPSLVFHHTVRRTVDLHLNTVPMDKVCTCTDNTAYSFRFVRLHPRYREKMMLFCCRLFQSVIKPVGDKNEQLNRRLLSCVIYQF